MKHTVLEVWQSRQGPARRERSCMASCPAPGPEHCIVIHAQKACLSGFCVRQVGVGAGRRDEPCGM